MSLRKPQESFIDLVDNSYNPFIPLIKQKYHTSIPIPDDVLHLQHVYNADPVSYRTVNLADCKKSITLYTHPYQQELYNLQYTPQQLEVCTKDIPVKSLESTPFQFIDTVETLTSLASTLNSTTEFAVDLEHHSIRSYLGITSLMQISTRDSDYIIDVISLRRHMHILQEPFANPLIVKVLHGADWDVKWLQRDFGIYVVNMFDTGQAARVLNFASFSLAHLLKEICKVTANKTYQLSDWRVRPIPPDMLKYAREDTHYLLFIYDTLRRKLGAAGRVKSPKEPLSFLLQTLKKSRDICLSLYQKPELKDYHYFMLIANHSASFKKLQTSVLKFMLKFRDYLGRLEDESPNYVCSNSVLVNIAKNVPTNYHELIECCKDRKLPYLIDKHSSQLFEAIKKRCKKYEDLVLNSANLPKPVRVSYEKPNIAPPTSLSETISRSSVIFTSPSKIQVDFNTSEKLTAYLFGDHIHNALTGSTNSSNLTDSWNVLDYHKSKNIFHEVKENEIESMNIEEEEQKVAIKSKNNKSSIKSDSPKKIVNKESQKYSKKMNKLNVISQMSASAKNDS